MIFFVCRALVKNMLIGYLKGPQSSKDQSLRLLGTVLNFNEEEFAKVRHPIILPCALLRFFIRFYRRNPAGCPLSGLDRHPKVLLQPP